MDKQSSTEPASLQDRISEAQRRGLLSMAEMRIVTELKRAGSAGKPARDINANLGMTLFETIKQLERLKALGLVEETTDALGVTRWRLAA